MHNPAQRPASCVAGAPLTRPKSRLGQAPPVMRTATEKRRFSKTIPFALQKVTFCTPKPYLLHCKTIPLAKPRFPPRHNNPQQPQNKPCHPATPNNRPRRPKPQQTKATKDFLDTKPAHSVKKKNIFGCFHNYFHYLCRGNHLSQETIILNIHHINTFISYEKDYITNGFGSYGRCRRKRTDRRRPAQQAA